MDLASLYEQPPVEIMLVCGLHDGKRVLIPEDRHTWLMPDPVPVTVASLDGPPTLAPMPYTTYRWTGSIRDDGLRVFTCASLSDSSGPGIVQLVSRANDTGGSVVTAAFPQRIKRNAHTARIKALIGRITIPSSLRTIASMPLTVAGLGCIDTGVFYASNVAGWIVTGLTLIGLEFLATDN